MFCEPVDRKVRWNFLLVIPLALLYVSFIGRLIIGVVTSL